MVIVGVYTHVWTCVYVCICVCVCAKRLQQAGCCRDRDRWWAIRGGEGGGGRRPADGRRGPRRGKLRILQVPTARVHLPSPLCHPVQPRRAYIRTGLLVPRHHSLTSVSFQSISYPKAHSHQVRQCIIRFHVSPAASSHRTTVRDHVFRVPTVRRKKTGSVHRGSTGEEDGRHWHDRARAIRLRGQRRVRERAQRQSVQSEDVGGQTHQRQRSQKPTHTEATEAVVADAEEAHQQIHQQQQATVGCAPSRDLLRGDRESEQHERGTGAPTAAGLGEC